jgi:hypothetical protein
VAYGYILAGTIKTINYILTAIETKRKRFRFRIYYYLRRLAFARSAIAGYKEGVGKIKKVELIRGQKVCIFIIVLV